MLTEYIERAMSHAQFELIEDGTIFGSIPELQGVWADDADTEEACRAELREVLEGWILLQVADHVALPVVDGMTIDVGSPT